MVAYSHQPGFITAWLLLAGCYMFTAGLGPTVPCRLPHAQLRAFPTFCNFSADANQTNKTQKILGFLYAELHQ